jgi:15-cis-phytoene synthase
MHSKVKFLFMKSIYDHLSARICKMTTCTYSTSFSMGIYFLDKRIRNGIYAIYGFVRVADEIVDSFHNYDKKRLLGLFKRETYDAIENGISCNPVLHAFQQAVHRYRIDRELIEAFLFSMDMDLEKQVYCEGKYQQYILGSAEVVGLMCLRVFTEGNESMYEDLKLYAMKLGAGFQKVNFLRDMRDDYRILGRVYFPNVDIENFSVAVKRQIEHEIGEDFELAREGIRRLPSSSKAGVYLAYVYYQSLFHKIKKIPAQELLSRRIRINNGKKFGLMLNSMLEYKMNLI